MGRKKGKRQKAKGKEVRRQKSEVIFYFPFVICHLSLLSFDIAID